MVVYSLLNFFKLCIVQYMLFNSQLDIRVLSSGVFNKRILEAWTVQFPCFPSIQSKPPPPQIQLSRLGTWEVLGKLSGRGSRGGFALFPEGISVIY